MHLPTPIDLKRDIPLSDIARAFIEKSRRDIIQILEGIDNRLLLIVGPCSIHNVDEGLLFAKKFKELADEMSDTCLLVMRSYIEKPRTKGGWKGFIYDPHLDGSGDLAFGLLKSRQFLVRLAEMGIPAATEFLTPYVVPYVEDTISWGCIGARTSSSQIHRLLASNLDMPVGFKNSIDGNIESAISGVAVAVSPHTFLHLDDNAKLCRVKSPGNPHSHIVLRGSLTSSNYDERTILNTLSKLGEQELPQRLLIDCSHGNSGGHYDNQKEVFDSVLMQIQEGNHHILGMMLECNLEEGQQTIPPQKLGVSVTDACLDFAAMAELVSFVSSSSSMSLTHS